MKDVTKEKAGWVGGLYIITSTILNPVFPSFFFPFSLLVVGTKRFISDVRRGTQSTG